TRRGVAHTQCSCQQDQPGGHKHYGGLSDWHATFATVIRRPLGSNTNQEVDMSTTHRHLGDLLHHSRAQAGGNDGSSDVSAGQVDMKLEVDIIPVSDVDRSKQFYERLGWRLDADDSPLEGLRIVQFTPPGSGASVTFGTGLTAAAPGSAEGGLIVSDIEAAHDELVGREIGTAPL